MPKKATLSRSAAAINRAMHPAEVAALLAAYEMYPRSYYYVITDEHTGKPRNIEHATAAQILACRGLIPPQLEQSA
ncbi:hypothetical protein [Deinococcus sp. Marseille-Q6407]|uniref:hypothetical protein n=1 Tax=Deinococcus sp. Marseille-Q6407 TaxID=2969223 RepID=UPI0021C23DD7|nr:hypothetical protein [Deinococcus sp. Marseille-Q6407]